MCGPGSAADAAPAPPASTATRSYSSYVLALLTLVFIVNSIDRQILAILIEPIKKEFGVSDTAMGFLTGLAFMVFYTLAGIPVARLADRASRKSIIAVALALWSLATAASGLARSFGELVLARVLVGVGEAGGTAPSHALISDYFPPQRRATALSIHACGVYIGAALAFLAGGWLVTYYDWRMAFFLVGLPGVALAVVVWMTVREPARGASEQRAADSANVPFRDVLRFLCTQRALVAITIGSALQSLAGYGVMNWGPSFLSRVHQMSWTQIDLSLGWTIGVAGCIGAFAGGSLGDRMGARDVRWYMRLPALQSILAVPFLVGFVLLPTASLALVCFVPYYLLSAMYLGPMFAMVQGLVDLRMRATAAAILMFIMNLVGLGLGPLAIGALNDYAFGPHFGQDAIRYSMLVVGLFGGFASVFFWYAARRLPTELVRR
ncbi:MAG: MFS transporter [Steroidobacteraceae bacterium]